MPGPQPPGAVSTQAPIAFVGITPLKDPNAPQIINLAWAADRIPVGEPIEGMFTAKNFKSGDTAKITVYEYDANGQKDQVDSLTTTITDEGTGHYTFSWTRTAQQASQDQQDDEAAGDTGPLEYRFMVEINGQVSLESSGSLHLTTTVRFVNHDELDKQIPEGSEVMLIASDGSRHYQVMQSNSATFNDILVGPISIGLVNNTNSET